MLEELSKYENLGTPAYFNELLRLLQSSEEQWNQKEVNGHFFNRMIDDRSLFDGCVPLLRFIKVLEHKKGRLIINTEFVDYLQSDEYLKAKLLEWFFSEAKNDEVFYEIFSSENISYDIIRQSIQIANSSFKFKYANVRQFLLDFDFLQPHPDRHIRKFIINSSFRKIFEINVLPEIRKRKVGIEELEKQLSIKQIHGEEAEIFVMEFEERRLLPDKQPERISLYSVNAGYDIVSFNDKSSADPDRFIEVKSYTGKPRFYWSRNEVDVAKVKKDSYFLYLVDRSRLKSDGYTPIIIQNPYKNLIAKSSKKWSREIDGYRISQV